MHGDFDGLFSVIFEHILSPYAVDLFVSFQVLALFIFVAVCMMLQALCWFSNSCFLCGRTTLKAEVRKELFVNGVNIFCQQHPIHPHDYELSSVSCTSCKI